MSALEIIQSIIERLQGKATVKTVFGDPIEFKGRTIIPVAKICYGFGAGSGKGGKQESADESEDGGSGSGGGGGIMVRPAGVLEITDTGARFIPFDDKRKLLGALMIGFLFGVVMAGSRR